MIGWFTFWAICFREVASAHPASDPFAEQSSVHKEGTYCESIPFLFCVFNQTENDRAVLCAARRVGKEEVLPVNDKGLLASLRTVVDNFKSTVLQIRCQIRSLLQQIVHFRMQTAVQRSDLLPISKRRPETFLPSSVTGYIVPPDCISSAYSL